MDAPEGAPSPGRQYAYTYDNIGNRIAVEDGDPVNKDLYKASKLNQIEQRNLAPWINVFNTAATNAVVMQVP